MVQPRMNGALVPGKDSRKFDKYVQHEDLRAFWHLLATLKILVDAPKSMIFVEINE
jgi:hypothetical protein